MSLLDLGGARLVLASASPRRAQLLGSVGLHFEVMPADIDESPRPEEEPVHYVARLSVEKASKVTALHPDAIVVAADTTVAVDGQILEKPLDDVDLRRMLGLLSGRTHHVHTGVTVHGPAGTESGEDRAGSIVVTTAVTFTALSESEVEWYVATGDGNDKAGGYGVQGAAGAFVSSVDGSFTNVVGLPLTETLDMIRRAAGTG